LAAEVGLRSQMLAMPVATVTRSVASSSSAACASASLLKGL
jgi:hypothetical protein